VTTPPPLNSRFTPPEFHRFADVVEQFVDATEMLLKDEMAHPFNIGSDAARDDAARDQHHGTTSKQTLLTLATQQGVAGTDQCDLLRGIATLLRADHIVLSPFPLARTCAVIAAKALHVLTAESREERLKRYLNEELAALYDRPMPSKDEEDYKEAVTDRTDRTDDYLAVGATAGLTPAPRKNPRPWVAPFLIYSGQEEFEALPSETQLMEDLYRAAGLQKANLARLPYSLLSAATHGRFWQAGLVKYAAAGPSVGGVSNAAKHVTIEITAQSTLYAALATRTYIRALARYTSVPEARVQEKLEQPFAAWFAIAYPAAAN
jgi:hypothetical protein